MKDINNRIKTIKNRGNNMNKIFKVATAFLFSSFLLTNINIMAKESKKEENPIITAYTINKIEKDLSGTTSSDASPDYYSMIDNKAEACTIHDPIKLRAVEELSDIVVKATFLGVDKQAELFDYELNYLRYAVTCSSIRVDEVYSGDVNVGDILTLIEPYFITEVENQKVINHFENYYPSETGQTYIWMLSKSTGAEHDPGFHFDPNKTYYSLAWCERGRFPVINTNARSETDISTMSNQDLDLSPNGDPEIYKRLYQEVIDKYMKQS